MNMETDVKKEIIGQDANGCSAHAPELILAKDRRALFIAGLPALVRGIFGRAYTGKSPTKAIKAKCIDCMGCEDYRNRVRDCKTVTCALHPYRPYQTEEGDE